MKKPSQFEPKMTKIDAIFLINFEAGHTHMADIREYLLPIGQSQREVCQVNTFQSAWAEATEWISAHKATHLHKSPHSSGLLYAQDIKIPAFLRL